MRYVRALCIVTALIGAACHRDRGVHVFLDETYPEKLSEWRLFAGPPGSLEPNTGVRRYSVRTPLFSDHADKSRLVWIPPNTKASVRADGTVDFPIGTVLVKTFSFPENGKERLIETRLLVHRRDTWVPIPYVWNREQTDASLAVSGDFTTVSYRDAAGEHKIDYSVPNVNQCHSCHDQAGDSIPLGPKARNLDAATLSYLSVSHPSLPPETLEGRAREYLDVNCAHCHNPTGSAMAIPLDLSYEQSDSRKFGVGQAATKPIDGAPDLRLVIDPGQPERSALVGRMASTDKSGMPTIGHNSVDAEGVRLISDWIRSLKRGT